MSKVFTDFEALALFLVLHPGDVVLWGDGKFYSYSPVTGCFYVEDVTIDGFSRVTVCSWLVESFLAAAEVETKKN